MNKNILIVLAGAVLVAVLAAFLVQMTLGGSKKPEVIQEAKVEVLVAAKDLGIGRELKKGDVRWQEWPKSSVFPGAAVREEGQDADKVFKDGRLARNIGKGEPVMKSALLSNAKGNMVSASLDPGQRAVAIEVDAASTAGGFIGPGDFVDIILTYRESVSSDDESPVIQNMIELNLDKLATETILQNVKILAVDQLAKRPEEDKVKVGRTVTVAVAMQDAERLFLASKLGDLTLALRGVGDEKVIEPSWPIVSDARLTNMNEEIFKEFEKLRGESGQNSNIIRVYNGEEIVVLPTN